MPCTFIVANVHVESFMVCTVDKMAQDVGMVVKVLSFPSSFIGY